MSPAATGRAAWTAEPSAGAVPVAAAGAGATAVVLVLVLVASPALAAGSLDVDPDPVPARGTAAVTATFDRAVEEADVVACRADGDREVLSCFRPVAMEPVDGGAWAAEVPPAGSVGDVPWVGLNASGTTGDGAAVHVPGGGQDYVFVAVEAADAGSSIPAPGAAGAVAAGLGVAVLAARRSS